MWNLDVIQESFEDVSLDYSCKRPLTRVSTISRQKSTPNVSRLNYSNASLPSNSSRELLLTPSQKLKMIKKQRLQKSADQLASNSPENLNSIDFLSDDVLPDNLIVFDVPSLHSLNSISTIKGRKPSLRRKTTISSNSSGEPATATNTHNITKQIESDVPNVYSNVIRPIFTSDYTPSSCMSSPATRASSIFSKSSDVSEFRFSQEESMSPLSQEVKLINDHRDVKLEETLQRMMLLKNLSQVDINQPNHKYISTTRQPNLPPKSRSEILKHENDYKSIVSKEISHEKQEFKKYQEKKKQIDDRNHKDERLWNQVMENYDTLINLPQTRELWWRYVSSKHRSKIWKKQFISEKKTVFEVSYLKQLIQNSADVINEACNFMSLKDEIIKRKVSSENAPLAKNVEIIKRFSKRIQLAFPENLLFQFGETFDSILKICLAFKELKKCNEKLTSIDEFVLVNLICVLFYVLNNEIDTLRCLVSLLLKKLPNTMLNSTSKEIPDFLSEDLKIETTQQSEYIRDINNQLSKYLLQVCPNLFNHFIQQDINLLRIIQGITCQFFSNQLPLDVVIRILDIYAFEGDIVLLRTSLALLKKVSFKLYGDRSSCFEVLNINEVRRSLQVGEVEEFIVDIRGILKKKA
ncbi:hypothetical protein CANINC_001445 [Pichia inconspicua]|uniref:Rab-GAP TBC domain-containing protein n=1 Tax=Pichia inconspicua TaxID=52247 RepID=A0A4T0X574_9ASCO|nr:hypothetical protein CANINC_001445 [[Candida] inconspicua]